MNKVSTIGIDLAKSVFQVHGADRARRDERDRLAVSIMRQRPSVPHPKAVHMTAPDQTRSSDQKKTLATRVPSTHDGIAVGTMLIFGQVLTPP